MTPSSRSASPLAASYEAITSVVSGLQEDDFGRPTGCAGWSVASLLFHVLLDAQRCLIALAKPSAQPVDTTAVTYWRKYAAAGGDDEGARSAHRRYVAASAAAYPRPAELVRHWTHTADAAVAAARRADSSARVATQGHVLALTDFLDTLVVEATLHHLDLAVDLPDAPAPPASGLDATTRTLEALLGRSLPETWDGVIAVRAVTGRGVVGAVDLAALGPAAELLPLIR